MTDGFALYCLDDLIGNTENGISAETHHYFLAVFILLESRQGKSSIDDRLKIAVGYVGYSRPTHQTAGKDVALVGLFWSLNAIGGHQNGAGKLGKFLSLILPGGAVMTVKMLVFL